MLKNDFYRNQYPRLIIAFVVMIFLVFVLIGIVLYQVFHRPLPIFIAASPNGKSMMLTALDEPNLLPATILRWASKAAVTAYTFDFVNYDKQISFARPYFTDAGWNDYQSSIRSLIQTIAKNQLFVNGVVSGAPVISNQGEFPGRGYVWRVQIPFLVTYQSADKNEQQDYTVIMTLVRIPTQINPAAIGVDQFVMR